MRKNCSEYTIYSALGRTKSYAYHRVYAQHAHAADAAARQRDRGDFGSHIISNAFPIYRCGTADARGVGWPPISAIAGINLLYASL